MAQRVVLRALQCGRFVLGVAEAVRGGRAPAQCLQAQIRAVPVGQTRLGGRVAGGEMTSRTAFTHCVAHGGTCNRQKRK